MGLSFKAGKLQTGDTTVTVGFQPKVVLFFSVGLGANAAIDSGTTTDDVDHPVAMMYGAATAANQFCASTSYDFSAKPVGFFSSSCCLHSTDSILVPQYDDSGSLTAFTSTGFTLSWTQGGDTAGTTYYGYLAIGGSDLTNAEVGHFLSNPTPGGIGGTPANKTVTLAGAFHPDAALFFATAQTNDGSQSSTNSLPNTVSIGAAASTSSRWYQTISLTNVGFITFTVESYTEIAENGVGVVGDPAGDSRIRLDLSSFNSDGFTIAHSATTVGVSDQFYVGFVALKGLSLKLNSFAASSGSQAVTNAGAQPLAVVAAGSTLTATGTDSTRSPVFIGVTDGTVYESLSANPYDDNTSGGGNRHEFSGSPHGFLTPIAPDASLLGRATLTSLDSSGFTINWSTAPSDTYLFEYIAFVALSTTYTYAVSGGITTGGAATRAKTKAPSGTGGLTSGGSAGLAKAKDYKPDGGTATTSGAAVFAKTKAFTAAGGGATSGSADVAKAKAYAADGGGTTTGGAAGKKKTKALTPDGGTTTTGGAADVAKEKAYAAMGGITTDGSAGLAKLKVYSAAGGASCGGTGSPAKTKAYAPDGGATTAGGVATATKTKTWISAGGLSSDGNATLLKVKVYAASGGPTAGGAAGVIFNPITQTFTYGGSGGMTCAGSATLAKGKAYTASGGEATDGGALLAKTKTMTAAGGAVTAGNGSATKTKAFAANGGATAAGGAATTRREPNYSPTGGATLAGALAIARTRAYPPSGGLTAAGAAILAITKAFLAAGGAITGGDGSPAKGKAFTGSGGASSSGSAGVSKGKNFSPSGGTTAGGAGTANKGKAYAPDGGATGLGGAAGIKTTKAITMTGGAIAGGTGVPVKVKIYTASGGPQPGGAAAHSRTRTYDGHGDMTLGGDVLVATTQRYSASGGLTTGGVMHSLVIRIFGRLGDTMFGRDAADILRQIVTPSDTGSVKNARETIFRAAGTLQQRGSSQRRRDQGEVNVAPTDKIYFGPEVPEIRINDYVVFDDGRKFLVVDVYRVRNHHVQVTLKNLNA